jgi:hypothetical protein
MLRQAPRARQEVCVVEVERGQDLLKWRGENGRFSFTDSGANKERPARRSDQRVDLRQRADIRTQFIRPTGNVET